MDNLTPLFTTGWVKNVYNSINLWIWLWQNSEKQSTTIHQPSPARHNYRENYLFFHRVVRNFFQPLSTAIITQINLLYHQLSTVSTAPIITTKEFKK